LNKSSKSKKRWLINCIKNHNNDKKVVKEVIEFVKESGGIDYTISKLKLFQKQALDSLSGFNDNLYKKSLIQLVNYVIEREY
jgi:octaprenyl-diphosphate synthase